MKMIELNRLSNDWNNLKEIVIYGFGRVALRNIKKLKADFQIKYVVDNAPDWELIGLHLEWPLKTFKEVKNDIKMHKIIVATSGAAYESIKEDLMCIGLEEFVDFCRLDEFFSEWYWKNREQICILQATSSLTSRCTFNCRHCGSLMPYFKKHYDYAVEDILIDLRLLFKRIDFLSSYYLVGGEPFLYKELDKLIYAVYEEFGERIGRMQIVSNGSVIPRQEVLCALKKCHVEVRLSDYTETVSYSKKFEKVKATLYAAGVDCSISKYDKWSITFPNPFNLGLKDEKEVEKHMKRCAPGCHALNDRKFYYCGNLFFSEKSGLFHLQEKDYIDLEDEWDAGIQGKMQFMKYYLGEVPGGTSLCAVCGGYGLDNKYIVKAAEQVDDIGGISNDGV